MNSFTIIFCLVLYVLALFCFFIPIKSGHKLTGQVAGILLGILITLTIVGNLEFLVIFIFPVILISQIIFITYWTFIFFGRNKAGRITTVILTTTFLYILLSPWIADWTFSKNDVRKILAFHHIELKDNFKILKNESGGYRDYYETFTLKISDSDFNAISQLIKNSTNYKGLFADYESLPSHDYKKYDTLDYETPNNIQREYYSNRIMENGTFHFSIQLDKQKQELSYTGSDE